MVPARVRLICSALACNAHESGVMPIWRRGESPEPWFARQGVSVSLGVLSKQNG
jgi:hypothetical protein